MTPSKPTAATKKSTATRRPAQSNSEDSEDDEAKSDGSDDIGDRLQAVRDLPPLEDLDPNDDANQTKRANSRKTNIHEPALFTASGKKKRAWKGYAPPRIPTLSSSADVAKWQVYSAPEQQECSFASEIH